MTNPSKILRDRLAAYALARSQFADASSCAFAKMSTVDAACHAADSADYWLVRACDLDAIEATAQMLANARESARVMGDDGPEYRRLINRQYEAIDALVKLAAGGQAQ